MSQNILIARASSVKVNNRLQYNIQHENKVNGSKVCIISYCKVLDFVLHEPLLEKLRAINVGPYIIILKSIASYLYTIATCI